MVTGRDANVETLRKQSFALDGDPGRLVVPEPAVKAWLAGQGIPVPRAVEAGDRASSLVLKAYGPGIVHKSDVGAVRLGLSPDGVEAAIEEMGDGLSDRGIAAASFFVEEMAPAGVEMIVGVVDHPTFGPVMAIGMGGTFAELTGDVAIAVLPVTADDIDAMLAELRGGSILDGARGATAVDRPALISVALGIANAAEALGGDLAELECNPVIVSPTGAVAADARLILHGTPREAREVPPATDFSLLFEPRGVAVAGASTTKSSFGNWMLEAMRDRGRANLVAIHPAASEIEGVVAYPSLDAVPHPVDYVMATVPARRCAELIAGAGRARFVHVISGGFREAGADGEDLERQLVAAARDANVRVLGPNCMGVFSPRGRLTFQLDAPRAVGHVSVVSQSGGLAADLIKVGDARGLRFSKLVSVGNAVDVTHAELLDWLVDDPDTDVVGLYIEDPRDGAGLVRALRRAAGRVPVVALVGGLSAQGGRAVASHTGALAADERIWQGISRSTGVTLVSSFEELVASLRFLQRHAGVVPTAGPNVLIAGVGGGATVLAADACDRAGLAIDLLGPGAKAVLSDRGYGVGTSIVNPIEIPIGPAVPPDLLATVLAAVLAEQPFSDLLVHLNVQQYFSFISGASGRLVPFIEAMGAASFGGARLALVVRNSECAPVEVRKAVEEACVANDLATFPTMYEAARAIGALQLFDRFRPRPAADATP
jgi:acyl-CoA synthetase (NDP forming)